MHAAARATSWPGAIKTGDLPPSSSVTGVSWALARRITSRPTAVEPVNSRWSNGRLAKACASATSPNATCASPPGKASASSVATAAAVRGVYSLILINTRLPAASASTSGPKARYSG